VLTARRPLLALAVALALQACSLGEGEGEVSSDRLVVTSCWDGPFQLGPDFFAAVPYRRTLSIKVQRGGETEEVSDGIVVLVDDIDEVRRRLGEPLRVALPPGVVPPGHPIVADPNPAIVHLTLYLQRSCHAQNSVLYAIDGQMIFHNIFNGDANETNASEMLTDAEFSDVTVADPREDPLVTSHIRGRFKFYFQRGQPAQPFP
jgi:hypothetical protein